MTNWNICDVSFFAKYASPNPFLHMWSFTPAVFHYKNDLMVLDKDIEVSDDVVMA